MINEKLLNNINELKNSLQNSKNHSIKIIVGLDGFVDEIIHVVDTRHDFKTFNRLSTISELGERISKAAGLSANIEFVSINEKCGGNGPILSNALIEYGVDLTYIGALGVPTINPVFKNIDEKGKIFSICNPGHTDALEFDDGKVMLGKIVSLNDITWDAIKEKVGGVSKFAEMIKEADLFAMENWTMIPYMSDIWEKIIEEVFPLLDTDKETIAFFDLADPEKRTKKDIAHAMSLIKNFSQKFKVILGLNEKEVYEIAEVFGIETNENIPRDENLKSIVAATYENLGIYCLVVHPTKEAVACIDGEYFHTVGPYCAKPVLTTGAGDNFSAGFCFAQSLGLNIDLSLLLGVCTSGFYVRNAKSPTIDDVIGFLDDWAKGEF